jgi:CDP-glucose 4,6-dehydratase
MAHQGIDNGFWQGRRVFLTGHTGFKGSWLSLWLCELGAKVGGYALAPTTEPNFFTRADIVSALTSTYGDVRDLDALTAAMHKAAPSIVLHLAAQPLVRESYKDPIGTLSTNVMGTANLCEAVRRVNRASPERPIRAVVVITSDKCYENREWHWSYRENDPLGGHDVYSASKACAEHVLASFRSSFSGESNPPVAMATARAGNVIGGGDWSADRLVPDSIRALEAGEPIVLRSPQAIRPWQHVLEPLAGYMLLSQKLVREGVEYSDAWNFGPDPSAEVSVLDLTRALVRIWGEGHISRPDSLHMHPHEATYLKLDSSKARSRLAWHPCLSLEQALDLTVLWYQKCRTASASTIREITLSQIRSYSNRLLEA